MMLQIA
jgi:hypothetical protein